MAKAKIQTERKSAKPGQSEQRFTISEIEQAKEQARQEGFTAGYRSAQLAVTSEMQALGLTDEIRKRTIDAWASILSRKF